LYPAIVYRALYSDAKAIKATASRTVLRPTEHPFSAMLQIVDGRRISNEIPKARRIGVARIAGESRLFE